MAQDFASRASMDLREMRSRDAGADGRRMANTFFESNRKTAGETAIAHYAAENPAINPEKTHLNWDFVNDSSGGFRESTSIDEMVAYAQSRRSKLLKAVKGAETEDPLVGSGERYAVTSVHHLPWYMLEPDGTTYHPLDRNGKPKDGQDGRPFVELPRYRIKPGMEGEARRYVNEALAFAATVLPGGQAAIIGGSFNVDESRPHVQFVADTFYSTPTKKKPDALSNGYSRAFGRHRDDLKNPQFSVEKGGRRVSIGARGKMELYHQQLKQHMLAAGFQIEAERDALRHDRRVGDKADYAQMRDDQRALDEHTVAELIEIETERELAQFDGQMSELDAAAEAVETRELARLDARTLVARERHKALAARDEYLVEAVAEAQEIVAGAREQADEITGAAEQRAAEAAETAVAEARKQWDETERPALAKAVREAEVDKLKKQWRRKRPQLVAKAEEEGRAEVAEELRKAREEREAAEKSRIAAKDHERAAAQAQERAKRDAETIERRKAEANEMWDAARKARDKVREQFSEEKLPEYMSAQVMKQLNGIRDAKTGQPVLQVALDRAKAEYDQSSQSTSFQTFMTETSRERGARIRGELDATAAQMAERAAQKQRTTSQRQGGG